ncbi:MAG: hypothetical protein IT328_12175 [Caldilineaceae bacterium]|nr:hypothetical protein [Caldilineaceae bacterium]
MALFGDALIEEISGLVGKRHRELGMALGKVTAQADQAQADAPTPLQRDLALLIQVANGEYLRGNASETLLQRVDLALRNLLGLLLGNALETHITIPDEFWNSDMGVLVSRVRWWLSADELITISNAAALAFGENSQANRMRIARAMEKGLLEWVIDPSVANPQQNRRVLRHQVERLREQSHLPE